MHYPHAGHHDLCSLCAENAVLPVPTCAVEMPTCRCDASPQSLREVHLHDSGGRISRAHSGQNGGKCEPAHALFALKMQPGPLHACCGDANLSLRCLAPVAAGRWICMTEEGGSARHTAGTTAAIARLEKARDRADGAGHREARGGHTSPPGSISGGLFLLHQNADYSASINGSGASRDSWRIWGVIWGFTPDTTPDYI